MNQQISTQYRASFLRHGVLLRDNALQLGIDVEVKHSPSHNTAILTLARGDAEAAVMSAAVFENIPEGINHRLRLLSSTKKAPNAMFMAGPDLSDAELQQLRKAMLAYTASDAGKAFFAVTGYADMGQIRDQGMLRLTPFVAEMNARMRHSAEGTP